jgi:hypothetical protein
MLHGKRQRLRVGLLACVALVATAVGHAATVPEHELKLALTYKVAKFVSWPGVLENPRNFALCVLGENPFEDALDGIGGLTVKDRAIDVHQAASLAELTPAGGCDLVFVARSEEQRLDGILATLADQPVLTVSDTPGFAARGGIVELEARGSRIGFTINVAAYRRAGLTISSQLLELATLLETTSEVSGQ